MRKKGLLALLLAVTLLMSGCALVTVDEAADNARVIVDVNGETVNKLTVHNAVHSVIEQNEYMNQFYTMLGGNVNLPTDEATVLTQVVDTYVNNLVAGQKAKELGFDQMTEEDTAAIEEEAEHEYQDYLSQVASNYLPGSTLEGDELLAEAEKYAQEHGMVGKDYFVQAVSEEKAVEKLRADTVKDVAVTEEDLEAAFTSHADANKASYDASPDAYGYAVNNGSTVYYAPAGYRMVKQILVKLAQEDSDAIAEKQTVLNDANKALTDAQDAVAAAAEGADLDALNAAVTDAEKAVEEATADLDAIRAAAFQAAKEKADEVYAKVTAEGADFDALVKEFNEDTGMPEVGYAVREGYSYFVESFTQAAMALENVGDVSEPTESEYGYHIIQYSADVPEGNVALDTVRDSLSEEVLTSKQNEAYNLALGEWINAADVKTYIEKMD